MEMIKCKCGCGILRKKYDKLSRRRYYIKGHYSRIRTSKFYHGVIKLEDLMEYFNKGLTQTEVAKIYKCTPATIQKYREIFNLTAKNTRGKYLKEYPGENKNYNISWSWIKGFFEGDGSIYKHQGRSHIKFVQKNPEILYKLKYFLQTGIISKHKQNRTYQYYIGRIKDVEYIKQKIEIAKKNYDYILGLIEAEGCFTLKNKTKILAITMNDKKIINNIRNILKIGKIYTYYYPKHSHTKRFYYYRVSNIKDFEKIIKILDNLTFISSNKKLQYLIWKNKYYNKQEQDLKKLKKLNYTDC